MSDYAESDPFWVEQREQFLATKSTSADPSACGTCRSLAESGKPVEHDECAQRATLLHAPDHPHYEILAGFSLEENAKLPARFHVPVFDDLGKPNLWLCAVCWEDGTTVQWPCKTAMEHGTKVFTPQYDAETAQKKQSAELAAYRALELGDPDGRVSASCGNPDHPTWLRTADDDRGCPWCRVAVLENALTVPVGDEPQPLDDTRLAEALAAYEGHPDLGFACCSAHAVAAQVPALRAEVQRLRSSRWDATKVTADLEDRLHAMHAELTQALARVAELEKAAEQIRFLHKDSPMGPCPTSQEAS